MFRRVPYWVRKQAGEEELCERVNCGRIAMSGVRRVFRDAAQAMVITVVNQT
jgi:hypothetical protein